MRTPVFELHILPMIRATDREHMRFAFDLWDYDQLVANAEAFVDRVAVDMPPAESGGPWPEEWVQLFCRWMASGFSERYAPGDNRSVSIRDAAGVHVVH